MTVRKNTITELTETDIKKWAARLTHARVKNRRKELCLRSVLKGQTRVSEVGGHT